MWTFHSFIAHAVRHETVGAMSYSSSLCQLLYNYQQLSSLCTSLPMSWRERERENGERGERKRGRQQEKHSTSPHFPVSWEEGPLCSVRHALCLRRKHLWDHCNQPWAGSQKGVLCTMHVYHTPRCLYSRIILLSLPSLPQLPPILLPPWQW